MQYSRDEGDPKNIYIKLYTRKKSKNYTLDKYAVKEKKICQINDKFFFIIYRQNR